MSATRRSIAGVLVAVLVAGLVLVALRLLETNPDSPASVSITPAADTSAPSAAALPESAALRPTETIELLPATAAPSPPTATGAAVADAGPQQHLLVVDQQNHAVPGALVEIWRLTGPMHMGEHRTGLPLFETTKTLRTDATGRCTVQIAGRAQDVSASQENLGCSGLRDADWLAKARNAQGESVLVLVPPLDFEGFVLEADGTPVNGAIVTVSANSSLEDYCGWPRDPLPFTSEKSGWFHGRTDFMKYANVYADAPDGRFAVANNVMNTPGQTTEVTLQLRGDWILGGFVHDDAGQPVAGARVVAIAVDELGDPLAAKNGFLAGHVNGTAAEDGSFALTIEKPGRYLVSAGRPLEAPPKDPGPHNFPSLGAPRARGPATASALVSISGRTAHPILSLVIPRAASITGHVVDARHEPLPQALVNLRAAPPAVLAVKPGSPPRLTTTTETEAAQDGSFRIDELPADGRFEIQASPRTPGADGPNPAAPWEPVEADGRDILLVVDVEALARSTGSIRARVVARGGEPVAGFRWGWCREGQASLALFQGCTTPDGSFEVPGLDVEARYTVAVETAEGRTADAHDVAPSPDGTPLLLTVAPPAALDVEVVDAHGAPIPGTHVLLRRSFSASWNVTNVALTDAQGRAHVEKLPQGHYTLKVKTGNGAGEAAVEVGDGVNKARIEVAPEKQG